MCSQRRLEMKDFMIFLLRGALGAIVVTAVPGLLYTMFTGYYLLVVFVLYLCSFEAAMGMIVGLGCWAAAGSSRRVGGVLRATIGTGIVYGIFLSINAYQLIYQPKQNDFSPANLLYYGLFLPIWAFAIGGVAA